MLESYFDEFLVKLVILDKRTSYTGDKISNIYEIYVVNIYTLNLYTNYTYIK